MSTSIILLPIHFEGERLPVFIFLLDAAAKIVSVPEATFEWFWRFCDSSTEPKEARALVVITHAETLLAALRERFDVVDGPATPVRHGHVAMFLQHHWYTIVLGEAPHGAAAADRLDVSRLQELVLGPLLGIGDVRSDKRIDFVGGARGSDELERLVTSGRAAVAFSLYPVGLEDLMAVCDAGGIMPPKSTWFEPKLRDGLLSHVI